MEELAGLFDVVSRMPLPAAAARLAGAGMPVFPCLPGGKRPLVTHGFHDASADAGLVSAWWRRWPAANIGLPTGQASGVDVVDVDRKAAGSGFAAFDSARHEGLVPDWLAVVRTPSGGAHFYFPADPARSQSSWQAAPARVDFRGAGGYVVVPPSKAGLGGGYVLVGRSGPHPAPVDASAFRGFLDPRPAPAFPGGGTTRVADAARLAGWVAALGEGERNRGLFWAACRLAEAGADAAATLDALGPAAERVGLPSREVVTTIRSAYRAVGSGTASSGPDSSGHGAVPRRPVVAAGQVLS